MMFFMKKNRVLTTAASVLAVLCLALVIACSNGSTSSGGGNNGKAPADDTTALSSAINDAEALYEENESFTTELESALNTFQAAIAAAQAVLNNAKATQKQVNDALAALEAAITAFETALDEAGIVTKAALNSAIAAAETLLASVAESVDGSELAAGTTWTAAANKTAYQTAINAATGVKNDDDAAQAQVDAAVATLAAATTTFNSHIYTAGSTPVDKDALASAINAAEIRVAGVTASDDGAGLDEGTHYAPQTAIAAYHTAINAAKAMIGNTSATQAQVDAAVSALASAATAFNSATSIVGGGELVDTADLEEAIEEAKIYLASIATSADGADVPSSSKWAAATDKAAFQDAIDDAQAVLDDPDAAQDGVDEAVDALAAAKALFVTKVDDGTMLPPPADLIFEWTHAANGNPAGMTWSSGANAAASVSTAKLAGKGSVITEVPLSISSNSNNNTDISYSNGIRFNGRGGNTQLILNIGTGIGRSASSSSSNHVSGGVFNFYNLPEGKNGIKITLATTVTQAALVDRFVRMTLNTNMSGEGTTPLTPAADARIFNYLAPNTNHFDSAADGAWDGTSYISRVFSPAEFDVPGKDTLKTAFFNIAVGGNSSNGAVITVTGIKIEYTDEGPAGKANVITVKTEADFADLPDHIILDRQERNGNKSTETIVFDRYITADWFIDGELEETDSGTLKLDAEDFADGDHDLLIRVEINGLWYSKQITIQVEG